MGDQGMTRVRDRLWRCLVLTAALIIGSCTNTPASRPAEAAKDVPRVEINAEREQPPTDVQITETRKLLATAVLLGQQGERRKSYETLQSVLASPGLRGLPLNQQHYAVSLAGEMALANGESKQALQMSRRAISMGDEQPGDWYYRMYAAAWEKEETEAVLCLTTLAQRWPAKAVGVEGDMVSRILQYTRKDPTGRARLLAALFAADYTTDSFDVSNWWRNLALAQLQQGDQAGAARTLAKVTAPYALVSILADARFDPVRASLSVDIPAAIQRQIQSGRDRIKAHPDRLVVVDRLVGDLHAALHFAEALQVADQAIAVMNGPDGSRAYTDYADKRVWVLNLRSDVLLSLGRWDEAVTQMAAAQQIPETGHANISQTINLAGFYNELGKPAQARAVLDGLTSGNISPYGSMQAAKERHWSAEQLGDAPEAARQLEYLQQHREDSLAALQSALIHSNRLDEAAQVLIARLQDPDERIGALLSVQHYKELRRPKRAEETFQRLQSIQNRPAVRDVIKQLGHVGDYPMLLRP